MEPDCAVCIYREMCDHAAEGTFCTIFKSEAPPAYDENADPNVLWARGEDVTI